ncbi:Uncharacterised protein [Cedecea lapagei]|uniref:Uncharacterized protein n=1 Tax=Cedecea lapagei TaxID=158823 RepID=A0A3S4JA18_9ENTR|nr:Uncharacterised protein [Cedecea lapagei]
MGALSGEPFSPSSVDQNRSSRKLRLARLEKTTAKIISKKKIIIVIR